MEPNSRRHSSTTETKSDSRRNSNQSTTESNSRRNSNKSTTESNSRRNSNNSTTESNRRRNSSKTEADVGGNEASLQAKRKSVDNDPHLAELLGALADIGLPLTAPAAGPVRRASGSELPRSREGSGTGSGIDVPAWVSPVQVSGSAPDAASVADETASQHTTESGSVPRTPQSYRGKGKPAAEITSKQYREFSKKAYDLYPENFPAKLRAIPTPARPAKQGPTKLQPGESPVKGAVASTTTTQQALVIEEVDAALPNSISQDYSASLLLSEAAKLARQNEVSTEGSAAHQDRWLEAQAEDLLHPGDEAAREQEPEPEQVPKLLLGRMPAAEEAVRRVSVSLGSSSSRVLQDEAAAQKNRTQFELRELLPLETLMRRYRMRPHQAMPGREAGQPDWQALAKTAGVLRLVRAAGTVGTCVLLHPDDVSEPGSETLPLQNVVVTARHLVVDALPGPNGKARWGLQEEAYEVNLGLVKHIASWNGVDISFFRIQDTRTVHYPRFDPHGPKPLRFPSSATRKFVLGEPVFLLAYPSLVDVLPWRAHDHPMDQPVLVSGVVSRILHPEFGIVADYKSFPGTQGGAVLSHQGELLGIHLRTILATDAQAKEAEPPVIGSSSEVPDQVTLTKEARTLCPSSKLERFADGHAAYAAANVTHKALLGLFVPWTTVRSRLLLSYNQLRAVVSASSGTE